MVQGVDVDIDHRVEDPCGVVDHQGVEGSRCVVVIVVVFRGVIDYVNHRVVDNVDHRVVDGGGVVDAHCVGCAEQGCQRGVARHHDIPGVRRLTVAPAVKLKVHLRQRINHSGAAGIVDAGTNSIVYNHIEWSLKYGSN